MKSPTPEEWKQLKTARVPAARKAPASPAALPDSLFLPDDYKAPEAMPEAGKPVRRRQFVRYDETWHSQILAAGRSVRPATHRLAAVLLAKADFDWRIKAGAEIEKEASVTRNEKLQALLQLETLGLVEVERRSGRLPVVTPLRLSGRPRRK
jgi:hypothetical protein